MNIIEKWQKIIVNNNAGVSLPALIFLKKYDIIYIENMKRGNRDAES